MDRKKKRLKAQGLPEVDTSAKAGSGELSRALFRVEVNLIVHLSRYILRDLEAISPPTSVSQKEIRRPQLVAFCQTPG